MRRVERVDGRLQNTVIHTPHVAERALREKRLMLRITPDMTFESPPRHVYKPDDVKGLTHDLGTSLPWTASP